MYENVDYGEIERAIVCFMKDYSSRGGVKKAIVGLSGGLDSSTVAFLACEAFRKENVFGLIMPYKTNIEEDTRHGLLVAEKINIEHKVIKIDSPVESFFSIIGDVDKFNKGNIMARCRMIILYSFAYRVHGLVLGTSNKTELLLGYGTKFGDLGADIYPLGSLYKFMVKNLARHVGVPDEIVSKSPSAGLGISSTDEEELGMSYSEIDDILIRIVEERYSFEELARLGYDERKVENIIKRIRGSEHKRQPPRFPKIGTREIGWDYRYPVERGI